MIEIKRRCPSCGSVATKFPHFKEWGLSGTPLYCFGSPRAATAAMENPREVSGQNTSKEKPMAEWNETCSQAPSNKRDIDFSPKYDSRERREDPKRMSDLSRKVDNILRKEVPNAVEDVFNSFPKLTETLKSPGYDKNTPGALKQLRWSIYELIECYEGDYGKTISGCLKQEVERLFQEFTHS